jgi:5'-AMP-activated protein kinase catalytic alpha subunit
MVGGQRYHGLKTDIWSCGIILFAMLCGYLPFEDPHTPTLYQKIIKQELRLPPFLSSRAKNLLTGILHKSPDQRLTIQEMRE